MALDLTRRRLIRTVNSKYIYGRIPLLHAIILFIEIALVVRLTAKFTSYYEERPVLTMMVTNAVLGGIADTVAQMLGAMRTRSASLKQGSLSKDNALSIEIHELDRKDGLLGRDYAPASTPSPFDFERLVRFMAYGFAMAPLQFRWFRFLETAFPLTKTSTWGPTLVRVACDQFIMAPFTIALFFIVMTIAEGGGKRAVQNKLREMYLPTMKTNYMVWPAVQLVNFRVMPIQFQLPFVSCVGIAWTAYLSLTNASDDAEEM